MVVVVLTRVVAVLTRVVAVLECRRFGISPFLLSPFRLVAVMTGTRMLDPHEIVITGGLNFHLDTETAPDVRRFSETLADHGMVQLVTDATHNKGHILDVVIVRINGAIIYTPPSVYDPCLCDNNGNPSGDHYAITFTVSARKPAKERKQLQF